MSRPQYCGSSAFLVLSNKEKVARVGLLRQRTPTECVRVDFLGEISSNAHLHWFGARSTQLLSTKGADDPQKRGNLRSKPWNDGITIPPRR